MTPRMRDGAPPQGPARKISRCQAPDPRPESSAPDSPDATVRIVERTFSATVSVPTAAAARLLRRTATAAGCEQESGNRWVVYGSRVARVVAELTAAGYTVEREAT